MLTILKSPRPPSLYSTLAIFFWIMPLGILQASSEHTRVSCYFLLNYAQDLQGRVSALNLEVLLFSFELCSERASGRDTTAHRGGLLFSFELCSRRVLAAARSAPATCLLFSFELCHPCCVHDEVLFQLVSLLLFSFELCTENACCGVSNA